MHASLTQPEVAAPISASRPTELALSYRSQPRGPGLRYTPLEPLDVRRPVNRLDYVSARCEGLRVLDLGCYDETARDKHETPDWLHRRIADRALSVVGLDNSEHLDRAGVATGPTSRINVGDVTRLADVIDPDDFDIVVGGELIEHLPDTLAFLQQIKRLFTGKALLLTTPNATSLTNVLIGLTGRESNHVDHLQVYSYKTLNTMLRRAGFQAWDVVPCHMSYSEMALRSGPVARLGVRGAQSTVNLAETAFPLLSGGLIAHVSLI